MDNRALWHFIREIENQCEYASIAAQDLNEAFDGRHLGPSGNPGLVRSFAACQALLGVAAMVSKIMWPASDRPRQRQRGSAVRQALQVRHLPVLESRVVRNSLEHFDERLDAFFEVTGGANVVDRLYGPADSIGLGPGIEMYFWRHIDPQAGTIRVMNQNLMVDEVSIAELIDALLDVKRRADRWLEANHPGDSRPRA